MAKTKTGKAVKKNLEAAGDQIKKDAAEVKKDVKEKVAAVKTVAKNVVKRIDARLEARRKYLSSPHFPKTRTKPAKATEPTND